MSETSRKTGIDVLEDFSWGTHVGLFYQTEAEVLEIVPSYFRAGLENNEFCLWIIPPSLRQEEAQEAMQKAVPNFSQYLAKGQMEVLPHKEWYLKGGQFDPSRVAKGWMAKLDEALDRGHEGLRAASGYARGKNEWGQVIGYEKEMNGLISRHPMIAMCAYPTKELAASEVIDLAASHRFILTKRETWQLIENAGLKQVDEALGKEEERHRLLLDSLPVLIAYVDSGQRYRFVNRAYEDWYGLPRREICGKHIKEVVGESGYQVIERYVERVLSGQQVSYEVWFPYESGDLRYVSVVYVPDLDETGKVRGFFALISDRTEVKRSEELLRTYREHLEELVEDRTADLRIANEQLQQEVIERKRAEEALRESEGRYQQVVEYADQGIVIVQDGVLKFPNPSALKITGYSAEELSSRPFLEFIHPEDRAVVAEDNFKIVQGKVSHPRYEFRILDKEGNCKWLETYATLISWENKPATLSVFSEITQRKEAEEKIRIYQEQLRSLASELELIEERERHRIASDLHDHIGHRLAISKIKLGELGERMSSSLVKPLEDIRKLIEETIEYTRSLTFDLSPPILYEFGFEPAVDWLTKQVREKHRLRVDFEDDKQPKPMEREMRILLFKVVGELLINIVKHAQANKAKVAIRREDSQIRITVEDDGVGFQISEVNPPGQSGGFGLFSVRERLRHLGGSLQIKSEPGRGTCITLVAPLTQKKNPEVYH